jgi:hypothetical protein
MKERKTVLTTAPKDRKKNRIGISRDERGEEKK